MPRDALTPSPHKLAFASRRRDPETKREAVLQTAAQLFLEKSYTRTSLNDVAERLHITKPALYHYFQNKEELLVEIYRLGSRMIEDILNEIAAHCGTGLDKVEAFIRSYANVMTVNFGRCVMRLDEGDLSLAAFTEVRAYKRKIDRRLRAFIQEGIADGSILPCDPKIAAFTIAGALNWICIWYEPEGPLTSEQIAAEFVRTLTQGLAVRRRRNGSGTHALRGENQSTGDSK
jgi:AcrR family transcriptional regulator